MSHFEIQDCTLLMRMGGIPTAVNLRELRDRIAVCSQNVIYYHFCETPLVPSFDNPDYRNDFAVWSKLHLGDRVLAERLGVLDPYSFADMEELRGVTLELIDERLSELPMVPSAQPGSEFYFKEAAIVIFDTGERVEHPGELASAIARMTNSSVYFHFLEARRRTPMGIDDFSLWLYQFGSEADHMTDVLQSLDFAFYTLAELRSALVSALGKAGGAQ